MNHKLHNALLPLNKHNKPDTRFIENISWILQDIGKENLDVLIDFHEKSEQLTSGATNAFYNVAMSCLRHADYLKYSRNTDIAGQHRWKSKSLRKRIGQVLGGSLKQQYANKLAAAATWEFELEHKTAWLDYLTPSHKYELAMMSELGVAHVVNLVADEDSNLVGGLPTSWTDISVRKLEEIRRQYPKKPKKKLLPEGIDRFKDDPNADHEEIDWRTKQDMDLYELIDDLVETALLLNVADFYKDQKAIAKLNKAKTNLYGLGHLAMEPAQARTKQTT